MFFVLDIFQPCQLVLTFSVLAFFISGNVLFLRATAECFARLCHRLGVCLSVRPSVRLSVTLVICI